MAELIAKPALLRDPIEAAGCRLSLSDPRPRAFVMPFPGQEEALAAAFEASGCALPGPGASARQGEMLVLWAGRACWMVEGPLPDGLSAHAAITDQSDGWHGLCLEGPGAADLLARFTPADLRLTALPAGSVLRTELGHMAAIIHRAEAERFDILTFRSMAETAWHELAAAIRMRAARHAASAEPFAVDAEAGAD